MKSGHRSVVRILEEYNIRSHKIAHTSSSANSITSGSTAETKPSCAVLYPGGSEWSEQQRRSMVSLGNHSSNSKSSSNLTGSSHSSRHGDRQRENTQNSQPLSFTQQLQQCSRGGKTRPLSKVLSPLQSEPQSPIYASPPLSPVHDIPNMFGMDSSKKNLILEFIIYFKLRSKYDFFFFRCHEYLSTSFETQQLCKSP